MLDIWSLNKLLKAFPSNAINKLSLFISCGNWCFKAAVTITRDRETVTPDCIIIIIMMMILSNLHEISGIDWIERKIKFQIFPILIFWVMVIFVLRIVNFRWIFTITQKIKFVKQFFHWWSYLPLTLLSARRKGLRGRRRKRWEVEERQARQELRRQARTLPQVQLG